MASKPKPINKSPVTAPPRNATVSAEFIPLWAACAVRTFARTAMTIPTYPASDDAPAPIKNPTAVSKPNLSETAPAPHNKANNTAATTATVLYWRFR